MVLCYKAAGAIVEIEASKGKRHSIGLDAGWLEIKAAVLRIGVPMESNALAAQDISISMSISADEGGEVFEDSDNGASSFSSSFTLLTAELLFLILFNSFIQDENHVKTRVKVCDEIPV